MPNGHAFAGYPSAVIYETPARTTPVQHLLWGDFVRVTGPRQGEWVPVSSRKVPGWMHESSLQEERILEVIFVDIGQGDGCLVVTPDDRHLLVDAGAGDNFCRFLRWRYNKFAKPFEFEAVVISHSDLDHYNGFQKVFDEANVRFRTIYHNGLVERAGEDLLGARDADGEFLTEIVRDRATLEALIEPEAARHRKMYPTMLWKALQSERVDDIRSLAAQDEFLPGYGADRELSLQVLGPVLEPDGEGRPRLRWLGDDGKTKNGHSVVLRLKYRNVSLLLGGDLNIPSEHLLLRHHTGLDVPPASREDEEALVAAARGVFRSDIAKACHHGSADFSTLFLRAVEPLATVISSGDDEPHAHPRADSLGAVGRFGRGDRPLVFSTELSRSTKEAVKHPAVLREKFRAARQRVEDAATPAAREAALAKYNELVDSLERSVAVFGAINLRTDGEKVVMGYKIEAPRRKDKKWDLYLLEPDPETGELRYLSKH